MFVKINNNEQYKLLVSTLNASRIDVNKNIDVSTVKYPKWLFLTKETWPSVGKCKTAVWYSDNIEDINSSYFDMTSDYEKIVKYMGL